MADIIKSRRDIAVNWKTANPVLAEGELGFETDTKRYKLGDGKSTWNNLQYWDVDSYLTCSSSANAKDKTISTDNFVLKTGFSAKIRMVNNNTYAGTNENPVTLNINNTGAKKLYYGGKAVDAGNTWEDGEVVDVYYDGESYYANNVGGNKGILTTKKDFSDYTEWSNGYIDDLGGISSQTGGTVSHSGYMECSGMTDIDISMPQFTTNPTQCIAFYDENKKFLLSYYRPQGTSTKKVIVNYKIPEGAYYFRTTYFKEEYWETYGEFYCVGSYKIWSEDIDNIKRELTEDIDISKRVEFISSGLIDIEGNASAQSSTRTLFSDFTDCYLFFSIDISMPIFKQTNTTTPVNQYVAFYDKDKNFISSMPRPKGDEDSMAIVNYKIPEGAYYFRTTYFKEEYWETYGEFYCKLIGFRTDYREYKNDKERQFCTLKLSQTDIVCGNYITNTGTATNSNVYGCTDFIPCKGASEVEYTQVVVDGDTLKSISYIAFYDKDKNFISGVPNKVGREISLEKVIVSIPQNAYYFRTTAFNYENSLLYGEFFATLVSPDICINGKRASNGESTYFSVLYNKRHIDLSFDTFDRECLPEELVCTTGVVLLPSNYSMNGKPSRVIIKFHGWSQMVRYKQWGLRAGFAEQNKRWADSGYAVVDVNGKDWSQNGNWSGLGSIQDLECYRKAWEYVRNNYNVEQTCFIVCGSAGGVSGINACYNWPDVRAAVWLDTWVDIKANYSVAKSCADYYFGTEGSYEEEKVGLCNPMSHITTIGEEKTLMLPDIPILMYDLTEGDRFLSSFVEYIDSKKVIKGNYKVRRCSVEDIDHNTLVSGFEGGDPKAKIVDQEVINFLNQY